MFTVHAKDEKETQMSSNFRTKQAALEFAANCGVSVLIKRSGKLESVFYPWHCNNG